jgi:uncharacterized membrane protein HdeD (DUF308 family)
MRRRTGLVEAGLALLAAAVVLLVAPGLADVAIISVIVLLVCGISLMTERLRHRRRAGRRPTPTRRPRA